MAMIDPALSLGQRRWDDLRLRQRALAAAVGLSPGYLSDLERDRGNPFSAGDASHMPSPGRTSTPTRGDPLAVGGRFVRKSLEIDAGTEFIRAKFLSVIVGLRSHSLTSAASTSRGVVHTVLMV